MSAGLWFLLAAVWLLLFRRYMRLRKAGALPVREREPGDTDWPIFRNTGY